MVRNGVCLSFLAQLLKLAQGHEFKMALYRWNAQIGDTTQGYAPAGEVSGPGYEAGGKKLEGFKIIEGIGECSISFETPIWNNATFSGRYALIYIDTLPGRPAVAVFDDYNGNDQNGETSARNGMFKANLPENAITLRLSRA